MGQIITDIYFISINFGKITTQKRRDSFFAFLPHNAGG